MYQRKVKVKQMATTEFKKALRLAGCTKMVKKFEKGIEGKLVASLLATYRYDDEGEFDKVELLFTLPGQFKVVRQGLLGYLNQTEEEADMPKNIFVGYYLTTSGYQFHAIVTETC